MELYRIFDPITRMGKYLTSNVKHTELINELKESRMLAEVGLLNIVDTSTRAIQSSISNTNKALLDPTTVIDFQKIVGEILSGIASTTEYRKLIDQAMHMIDLNTGLLRTISETQKELLLKSFPISSSYASPILSASDIIDKIHEDLAKQLGIIRIENNEVGLSYYKNRILLFNIHEMSIVGSKNDEFNFGIVSIPTYPILEAGLPNSSLNMLNVTIQNGHRDIAFYTANKIRSDESYIEIIMTELIKLLPTRFQKHPFYRALINKKSKAVIGIDWPDNISDIMNEFRHLKMSGTGDMSISTHHLNPVANGLINRFGILWQGRDHLTNKRELRSIIQQLYHTNVISHQKFKEFITMLE